MDNKTISSQIRLPANIHSYIQTEAARLGIAQNAFLIVLLEQGRKVWEAMPILRVEGQ